MHVGFPPNPDDKTVFEVMPGLFYIYDARSNCWNRLNGFDSLKPATALSDGLMSKGDYAKLNELLVPPPQTSLQGEDCEIQFRKGTVGLYSTDQSLDITSSPAINGLNTSNDVTWELHNNTVGFDFRININQLLNEINDRGILKKTQLQGDKGPRGPKGDSGRDKLDTGPIGQEGLDGSNSPFAGSISAEATPLEGVEDAINKAIVDLNVEVGANGDYKLVATRANIGDPDACPTLVTPKNFESQLLLALNDSDNKLVRNQTVQSSSGDCSLVCRVCSSSIHHLDVEPIVELLIEHFKSRIVKLKSDKEELINSWLSVMISLFNQQKAALCCALENCRSRKRNQDTRRYIESQRLTAAANNLSIEISSDDSDKQITDMDAYKDCPVSASASDSVIFTKDGVIFNLDGKIHIIDPRTGNKAQSLTANLSAGSYVAEITNCCANFNNDIGNSYSGRTAILYQAVSSISGAIDRQTIESKAIAFPDLGSFSNNLAAKSSYQGITITFEHAGGNISAWLLDPNGLVDDNDGGVTITITSASAVSTSSAPANIVYVYRNEVSIDNFVTDIVPFTDSVAAKDYLNIDSNDDVNPTGISLLESKAQFFFYDGTDGLHMFFVAGATPDPEEPSDFVANIDIAFEIADNSFPTSIIVQDNDSDVKQQTSTTFSGSLVVDQGSTGFGVGEIDPDSNYAIIVDPVNLDTITDLVVVDPSDGDIILAQGGTDGIGAQTLEIRDVASVSIFDVSGGSVDEVFAGGNTNAILVNNTIAGQNVVITRPISLDIPSSIASEERIDVAISPPVPDPIAVEEDDEQQQFDNPVFDNKGNIIESGEPAVSEQDSQLPRGAQGSPLDPCIQDIVLGIFPSTILSIRYVLTDTDGIKYYSAFNSIDPALAVNWSFLSLGPPVSILAPPDVFDSTVINQKSIDIERLKSLLTTDQYKIALNLEGLSRLTYVQSLYGSPIDDLPDGRSMTDIELEIQDMPGSFFVLGAIIAIVGLPGALSEIIIDDFGITRKTLVAGEDPILGKVKRVVGTTLGSSDPNTGILYGSLASYYGDYTGRDVFSRNRVDFNGNNFFSINESNSFNIAHIRNDFKFVRDNPGGDQPPRLIRPHGKGADQSGAIQGDAIVVDDFGVVYVADGPSGQIIAYLARNAIIDNTAFGDAHSDSRNVARVVATGLPTTDRAVIALGRTFWERGIFQIELICNFGGQWFKVIGVRHERMFDPQNNAIRQDITTLRCCVGVGNPPNRHRPVAVVDGGITITPLAKGSGGNSIDTNRPSNPQPIQRRHKISSGEAAAINAQLDDEFNQFEVFSLDGNVIYKVVPETGTREVWRKLPEVGFGLKFNPVTGDAYYIVNDGGTTRPRSGSLIKRVDIRDINPDTDLMEIKSVYEAENNERIYAIDFGNTVPPDPTLKSAALYAILSDLHETTGTVTTRLVEISELTVPVGPGPEFDNKVPTNSPWFGAGTDDGMGGPGHNANRFIFSKISPGSGCQMHYKQVQWYERGWRIGACCGALVELSTDNWWIVVKRSIGIDITCGGGESDRTPCIRQFIDAGDGHPAIAWPTLPPEAPGAVPGGGGDEFIGLPTSGFVNFTKDTPMSNALLTAIGLGRSVKIFGNPINEMPFIIFPSL